MLPCYIKDYMKFFTVPNIITFARIATLPWLWTQLWYHHFITATILFFMLIITDFLDGFLARRFSWQSAVGAALDPLADKLLVCGTLLILIVQCVSVTSEVLAPECVVQMKALCWMLGIKELVFIAAAAYLLVQRIPLLRVTDRAKLLTAAEFVFLLYVLLCQVYPTLFYALVFKFFVYFIACLLGSVTMNYAVTFYYAITQTGVIYEQE